MTTDDMPDQESGLRDWLRQLQAEPHRFGFFNAIRLFDCLYRDQPRSGRADRPRDEPVRIGQEPSLSFPGATLASCEPQGDSDRWSLRQFFFGLFGPHGPLPLHLTEQVYDRLRGDRDETLARFADLFHHRLALLFYRAWAGARPTVQFDRPEEDRFGDYVGSLCGIGWDSLLHRDAMPDVAKRAFAGHLACHTRHLEGLRSLLAEFFGVPTRITEFVGHWLELPAECCCQLGQSPDTGTLGMTATLGARVWDCQQNFRIELGPLQFADYCRLLPGGASLARLVAIVRNYAGDELLWDLRLVLAKDEVPGVRLGQAGHLGWTAWLPSRRRTTDAADLLFTP